tara:strand:+ start:62 stop:1096 length:1035 start_codon:yes stop_codon:yes gene_type:complete
MKKNLLLLLAVLILGGVAYYLYNNDSNGTLAEEYADFAVKDTANVTSFRITTLNQSTRLTRKEKKWLVNDKLNARPDAINLILKTFHQIKVSSPVSDFYAKGVVKRLSTSAIKVEIFTKNSGDKPEKVWYVGDATPNNLGTYMLLEVDGKKSSRAMITHLPSNYGYLTSRFFLKEELWKDPIALRMPAKEIRTITVKSPSREQNEFSIEHLGENEFVYKNLKTEESQPINFEIAIPYFKRASKLAYEYEDVKTEKVELDSIFSSKPQYVLTLENTNGEKQELSAYYMPVKKNAKDLKGQMLNYHNERMYARSSLNDDRSLVIQNFLFDQVLKADAILDPESVNK